MADWQSAPDPFSLLSAHFLTVLRYKQRRFSPSLRYYVLALEGLLSNTVKGSFQINTAIYQLAKIFSLNLLLDSSN